MIRLKKGGVVREVATQHEADYYEKIGYSVEDSGKTEATENDGSKKPENPGKKGQAKEE